MCRPLVVALAAVLSLGCGGGGTGNGETVAGGGNDPERVGYPTHLAAPSDLPGEWSLDQEVTIVHPQGEHSFRAVLQKHGDELVMLGLAPHGARAFLLTQRGTEISFEQYVSLELPFPPEYMLHDVHRTWLVPAELPEGGSERTYEAHGERISERWANGNLLERTFTRLDGRPAGVITVTYGEPGLAPNAPASAEPPETAELDNGWFGYRARVRTLGATPLPE